MAMNLIIMHKKKSCTVSTSKKNKPVTKLWELNGSFHCEFCEKLMQINDIAGCDDEYDILCDQCFFKRNPNYKDNIENDLW